MKSKHIGSSFDDFLKVEGIYEEAAAHAIIGYAFMQMNNRVALNNTGSSSIAALMYRNHEYDYEYFGN